MTKTESKPIRTISWIDEIIKFIIFQLILRKIIDFLWKRARIKLTFEGQIHFARRLFVKFGIPILSFMFGFLAYIPEAKDAHEYSDSLKRFLRLHRRYHQFTENKTCNVCFLISITKFHFQKYVSDPKLYPPFNF